MSSRFSRPDDRSDLFSSYNRSASPSKSKNKPRPGAASSSPYNAYGYTAPAAPAYGDAGAGASSLYPGGSGSGYGVGGSSGDRRRSYDDRGGGGGGDDATTFRSAAPNSRGQYSAAVLDELESQNEEHVGVLTGKVRMLKDVGLIFFFPVLPWNCGGRVRVSVKSVEERKERRKKC